MFCMSLSPDWCCSFLFAPFVCCVMRCVHQLAAVLVVDDPQLRAALQSELTAICLLAKLDPAKVSLSTSGGMHASTGALPLHVLRVCSQTTAALLAQPVFTNTMSACWPHPACIFLWCHTLRSGSVLMPSGAVFRVFSCRHTLARMLLHALLSCTLLTSRLQHTCWGQAQPLAKLQLSQRAWGF